MLGAKRLYIRGINERYIDFLDDLVENANLNRTENLVTRKDITEEIFDFYIKNKNTIYTEKSIEDLEIIYQETAKQLDDLQNLVRDLLNEQTTLVGLELRKRGWINE